MSKVNTEREILLYYLSNLIRSSVSKELESRICDWFEEYADWLIQRDVGKEWEPRHRFPRKEDESEQLPRCLSTLKKWLTPLSTRSIQSRIANVIMKTFHLTEAERPVILFHVLQIENERLSSFFDDITRYDNTAVLSRMLRMTTREYEGLFSPQGRLRHTGLFNPDNGRTGYTPTHLFTDLVLSRVRSVKDVYNMVLGKPLRGNLSPANFLHLADEYTAIRDLVSGAADSQEPGVNILLYGAPGTGKTEMVKTICREAGIPLYEVSQRGRERTGAERRLDLFAADSLLKHVGRAALLVDEAEDIFDQGREFGPGQSKLYLNRLLERNSVPVIWVSNSVKGVDQSQMRRFLHITQMPGPDSEAQKKIWRKNARKHGVKMASKEIDRLVQVYDLTPALIDSSLRSAKLMKDSKAIETTIESLIDIGGGKRRPAAVSGVETPFSTKLLQCDTDLERLADQIVLGKCLNFKLCLYGVPGSGKTAYARFLADKLGMTMIKKRASDIMNPFVGMTERNIAQMFREAYFKKALLVLDEADSFLRDRRYAKYNWEVSGVNEMLTQMEAYPYPFICTTNLMSDLDQASLRRFTFKVCYDYLTPSQVEDAYRLFFGEPATESLDGLTSLTPGDFATVAHKASILGIADAAERIKMLWQEQAVKDVQTSSGTPIGFCV